MQDLARKAIEAADALLIIHTSNEGIDPTHHEFTNIYKDFQEFAHDIAEKCADNDDPLEVRTKEEFRQDAYDVVESFLSDVTACIKEKQSIGADNLLRTQVEQLEKLCRKAKSFVVECEDEEEEDKETPEEEKKEPKTIEDYISKQK